MALSRLPANHADRALVLAIALCRTRLGKPTRAPPIPGHEAVAIADSPATTSLSCGF